MAFWKAGRRHMRFAECAKRSVAAIVERKGYAQRRVIGLDVACTARCESEEQSRVALVFNARSTSLRS